MGTFTTAKTINRVLAAGLVLAALGLLTWAAQRYVPMWIDWPTYRRAALAMAAGQNPYLVQGDFYNPPWILIPLIPIALLPEKWGGAVLLTLSLLVLAALAIHLKARLPKIVGLLLSLPALYLLYSGQIDVLCLAGIAMNPVLGLFLVLAKPQIGVGVAVFWAWRSWKQGGWRRLLITFAPVGVTYILAFLAYYPYLLRGADVIDMGWNYSIWPVSIPFGLALLSLAIRKNKLEWALIAGPLLSPYLGFYSWTGAILGALALGPEFYLVAAGSWLPLFFSNGVKTN